MGEQHNHHVTFWHSLFGAGIQFDKHVISWRTHRLSQLVDGVIVRVRMI